MRVIAGSAKGRRLQMPPAAGVRPTSDRARETLFNVLAPDISGARFLDVFAGSGAIGIEALSRGALTATFVERSRKVAAVLRANVATCGFAATSNVLVADWRTALRRLGKDAAVFDLAFFDPPYDWGHAGDCLDVLHRYDLLAPGGRAIVEHRKTAPPEAPEGWRSIRRIDVGDTAFSILHRPSTLI